MRAPVSGASAPAPSEWAWGAQSRGRGARGARPQGRGALGRGVLGAGAAGALGEERFPAGARAACVPSHPCLHARASLYVHSCLHVHFCARARGLICPRVRVCPCVRLCTLVFARRSGRERDQGPCLGGGGALVSAQGVGDSSGLTFQRSGLLRRAARTRSGKGSRTLASARRRAAPPEFPAEEKGA